MSTDKPEIENLDYKPNNTINRSMVSRAITQAKRIEDIISNLSIKSTKKDQAVEDINMFHRKTLAELLESLK